MAFWNRGGDDVDAEAEEALEEYKSFFGGFDAGNDAEPGNGRIPDGASGLPFDPHVFASTYRWALAIGIPLALLTAAIRPGLLIVILASMGVFIGHRLFFPAVMRGMAGASPRDAMLAFVGAALWIFSFFMAFTIGGPALFLPPFIFFAVDILFVVSLHYGIALGAAVSLWVMTGLIAALFHIFGFPIALQGIIYGITAIVLGQMKVGAFGYYNSWPREMLTAGSSIVFLLSLYGMLQTVYAAGIFNITFWGSLGTAILTGLYLLMDQNYQHVVHVWKGIFKQLHTPGGSRMLGVPSFMWGGLALTAIGLLTTPPASRGFLSIGTGFFPVGLAALFIFAGGLLLGPVSLYELPLVIRRLQRRIQRMGGGPEAEMGAAGPMFDRWDKAERRTKQTEWNDRIRRLRQEERQLLDERETVMEQMRAAQQHGDMETAEQRAQRVQQLDDAIEENRRKQKDIMWSGDRARR